MAWGKTDEEKQQEAAARAAAAQQAAAAAEAQRQRVLEQQAQAQFAASPRGGARAAFARGDSFFQAEIEVSALDGPSSSFGSSDNQIRRSGGGTDVLGAIEAEGWHLEHAGYVFIETGSTSTDRMFASGEGTVTRGTVMGIYLFRRAVPLASAAASAVAGAGASA